MLAGRIPGISVHIYERVSFVHPADHEWMMLDVFAHKCVPLDVQTLIDARVPDDAQHPRPGVGESFTSSIAVVIPRGWAERLEVNLHRPTFLSIPHLCFVSL